MDKHYPYIGGISRAKPPCRQGEWTGGGGIGLVQLSHLFA